jgi:hypothetical protein
MHKLKIKLSNDAILFISLEYPAVKFTQQKKAHLQLLLSLLFDFDVRGHLLFRQAQKQIFP